MGKNTWVAYIGKNPKEMKEKVNTALELQIKGSFHDETVLIKTLGMI